MLNAKTIILFILISSVLYGLFISPKKIFTLRGIQLLAILITYFFFIFGILPLTSINFAVLVLIYIIFVYYPQFLAKKILDNLISLQREKEDTIKKDLKKLFWLTLNFKALKNDSPIEYFLTNAENSANKFPDSNPNPVIESNFIKRHDVQITKALAISVIFLFTITYTPNPVLFQANLIKYGGNFYKFVEKGEYFRFFTSLFLHANFMHLIMNLFALLYLGSFMERTVKKRAFFYSVFVTGGTVASFFSYFFSKQNSVGASGAIFALIGSLLSIVLLNKELNENIRKRLLKDIVFIIIINALLGISVKNIDNYAHAGGFLAGMFFTLLIYKFENKALSLLFDSIAIAITVYSLAMFYVSLKNSYPEKINFTQEIKINNEIFKIPQSWNKLNEKNIYEDSYFSRFSIEAINENIYNAVQYITPEIIKREFNGKKINNFENITFKINNNTIKLIKFSVLFSKNDIRIIRIYFFKFKNKYYRITASFFKASYEKYGEITVNFLEKNLK